jgi:hypothetical protein
MDIKIMTEIPKSSVRVFVPDKKRNIEKCIYTVNPDIFRHPVMKSHDFISKMLPIS